MKQLKTALFDFDGVIVDTEPIYDIFWNEAAIKYNIGIDNFPQIIKGSTLPTIVEKYFSHYPEAIRQQIRNENVAYESQMDIPPMPGSIEFLETLKKNGVQIGLVTSSDYAKVARSSRLLGLEGLFDTIVTSDRITQGKPHPSCYLLAASDLGVAPENCLVFEDSFAGIQAGTSAGMRVIALSTTNPADSLQDKAYQVIPNFVNITFEEYLKW